MNPQDLKALLGVLNRIAGALEGKYPRALKHAINVIRMYESNIEGLKDYIDAGYKVENFCQGSIYKSAVKDIKKTAGIK